MLSTMRSVVGLGMRRQLALSSSTFLSTSPLAFRPMATIGAVLDSNAAAHGAKEVVSAPFQDVAWDFNEYKSHSDALARGLLELGYTRGSKLAVWMTNEAAHICAHFAAAKIGVVLVSIDPALSASAVGDILKDESCRGLLYSDRFNGEHRTASLKSLIPELESATWGDQVRSKSFRSLKNLITTGFEVEDGFTQYSEFVVYGSVEDDLPRIAARASEEDVVVQPYSCGADTDTAVKGKALSHKDLLATAESAAAGMKLTGEDTLLLAAPLHSSKGLSGGALAAALTGAKIVIPSKEFNAESAVAAVAKSHVTAVSALDSQREALPSSLKSA